MKVLVTGATGFTGGYVVPLLLKHGAQVRCLVRPSSDTRLLADSQCVLVQGDLQNGTSLKAAFEGIEALINIASLGDGHVSNVVAAAKAGGVQRVLLISTTAVFTTLNAPGKSIRLVAEQMIRDSGLAYTILRPTMIYGSARDRNMSRLIRYLQRWPIIPVFGDGEHLQQPVYVKDVAAAIVQSLETTKTIRKSYNIAGAEPLSFNQIIETTCEALKRRVGKVHLPAGPVVTLLSALERFSLRLPVKAEQVMRLNEHKMFDISEAVQDFDYRPRSFAEGIRLEVEEIARP